MDESDKKPEKHPLDWELVKPGDYFDAAFIERVMGVSAQDPSFRFKLLALKEEFERKTPFVVKEEGNGLRVLTHAEADDYLDSRATCHLRGLFRTVDRRTRIDRSEFDDVRARGAEHRDRIWSSVALAAASEKKKQERLLPRKAKKISE